jgi:Uri superfamily endonuclease
MTQRTIRKGTYSLLIQLKTDQTIQIGKKGEFNFNKGYYVYVGSALNSLDARIRRHLGNEKKLHWHVDYLLENPQSRIVGVYLLDDGVKHECEVANTIAGEGTEVKGFGCSDCKCNSHLVYFALAAEGESACKNAFKKIGLKLGKLE